MKIIEIEKNGWQKRVCTGEGNNNVGCGSLLLLDIEDIKVTYHTWLDGDIDTYYSFVCPVCGAMTDIPSGELPASIKEETKSGKVKTISRKR